MPKSFFVKRTTKQIGTFFHRNRNFLEDENNSDQEVINTHFESPDSGYSPSPLFASFRERYEHDAELCSGGAPFSSPLTVGNCSYFSPLYFSTFDRPTVCNNNCINKNISKEVISEATNVSKSTQITAAIKLKESSYEISKLNTPKSPNICRANTENTENKTKLKTFFKAVRKINFDDDTSSPVSGIIIRKLSDDINGARFVCGDIDSKFNCVEGTPQAKNEIAKIRNLIGDYICRLCKEFFEDAFQLAQHRCSMIISIEYKCPDCDNVFHCQANIASHRRRHTPRSDAIKKASAPNKITPAVMSDGKCDQSKFEVTTADNSQFHRNKCDKQFQRQAYVRKHQQTHVTPQEQELDAIFVRLYCSKIFSYDTACAKHEQTHADGKELTCTLCSSSFSNKIVLEKHVR